LIGNSLLLLLLRDGAICTETNLAQTLAAEYDQFGKMPIRHPALTKAADT
jgi:hypothetical protein